MKIKGKICKEEVVVMIDYGPTCNFISTELVARMGIPCHQTTSYGVFMGTGLPVKGEGICREVVVTL